MKTVAVIGAGTMGAGIAQASALAGYQVLLYDVADEVLAASVSVPNDEHLFAIHADDAVRARHHGAGVDRDRGGGRGAEQHGDDGRHKLAHAFSV